MGPGISGISARSKRLSLLLVVIIAMTVLTKAAVSPAPRLSHQPMASAPQVMAGSQWSLYDLSSLSKARLCGDYRNNGFSQIIMGEEPVSQRVRIDIELNDLTDNTAFPVNHSALPPSVKPYLIQTVGGESLDHLSRFLTRDCLTVFDAVVSVLCWISTEIPYGSGENLPENPLDVLDERRASCVGAANLAVSMFRSIGIPARCVRGLYFPQEFETENFNANRQEMSLEKGGLHRWVEVYYPDTGWVFCDPLRSANHIDDRYLVFEIEKPAGLNESGATRGRPEWSGLWSGIRSVIDPGSVIITRMEQGGVLYPLDIMPNYLARQGMTIRRNEPVRFRPGLVGRIEIASSGTPEPDRVELVRLEKGKATAVPFRRWSRIGEGLFSFTNLITGSYRLRFFHESRLLAEKAVEVTFPPVSAEPFTVAISSPSQAGDATDGDSY